MRSILQTVIIFTVAAAVSVFGQERPPAAGAAVAVPEPFVVLEAESTRAVPVATLSSAAHANDFATFDALFRANGIEAYRPLHELWTYSVTDPIGAFYGPEMFERFARAYPRFAESMDRYRIIDARGNAFYPSSETRAFLLTQAEQGTVADLAPIVRETPLPVLSKRTTRIVPVEKQRTVPPDAAQPDPPSAPPVPREPLPVAVAAAQAVVIRPESVATIDPPPAATTTENHGSSSGLLLMIIGLLGAGVLALILRAPREVPS